MAGLDTCLGADVLHRRHELVAKDLRERDQRRHGVVHLALGVLHEHLLGVRSTDAGHARAEHDPVGTDRLGVLDLDEVHRGRRQTFEKSVGVVGRRLAFGLDAEDERLHALVLFTQPTTPSMKPSMSACFMSTTGFMSGR